MDCVKCLDLERELLETRSERDWLRERLAAIERVVSQTTERPVPTREYATPVGKAVAAAASLKGVKLSEVSKAAGFSSDYAGKVCRGTVPLSVRNARLLGQELGIDLLPYVDRDRFPVPAGVVSVPIAPGVNVPLPFPVGREEVA